MAHQIAERFLGLKKRVVLLEVELDTHYQGGRPMETLHKFCIHSLID
jgi:hypothetical protein